MTRNPQPVLILCITIVAMFCSSCGTPKENSEKPLPEYNEDTHNENSSSLSILSTNEIQCPQGTTLVASTCVNTPQLSPGYVISTSDIEAQKAIWDRNDPKNFYYTLTQFDESNTHFKRVTVGNGQILKTVTARGSRYRLYPPDEVTTIDQLFNLLLELASEPETGWRVDFHRDFGFPVSIAIEKDSTGSNSEYVYTGYLVEEFSTVQSDNHDRFYSALQLWQSHGLYRYSYNLNGIYKASIEWQNNQLTHIPGNSVASDEIKYFSINDLFYLLKRDLNTADAAFNEPYGFPQTIEFPKNATNSSGSSIFISDFERFNEAELVKLETQKLQWEQLNIRHYRYRLDYICLIFCDPDVSAIVEVKDGEIIHIENLRDDKQLSADDITSIDAMFKFVERDVRAGENIIDYSFDTQFYFPTSWNNVPKNLPEGDSFDSNQYYEISEFTVIED